MNLQNDQNLNKFSALQTDDNNVAFDELENDPTDTPNNTKLNDFSSRLFGYSLPVQATSNDVREIVRFFKYKPLGLSFAEVLNSEPRRIFEPRKIEAYESWGIIKRAGERLILAPLGSKIADIVSAENKIFQEVIISIPIYVEIIQWINSQNLKLVTHPDIVEFFSQLQKDQPPTGISEAEVVSFFSICHAAELGVATVGKRGQPARLRIEAKRIEEFLSQNNDGRRSLNFESNLSNSPGSLVAIQDTEQNNSVIKRVYISVASDVEFAESLSGTLELADFKSSIYSSHENDDYLQSEKLFNMRLCQAGIIIINDEDCCSNTDGKTEIKSERLTEISMAAGLFNWRVIIVWDSLLPIPQYLENYDLHLLVNSSNDYKTSFQTAKLLKNMKYQ